jgi:O-acetylserine/cysteine efflux transporter
MKMLVFYGLVMFAMQFALLFTGMRMGMTAGLASLLMQTQVFFTIIFAVIFMGEKPTFWQIVGALISFAGIVVVGLNVGGNYSVSGFFLVIAAAISWGAGNLISKKMGKVNMFSLVVWGSFIAWPPLFLVAMLLEGSDKILYSLHHISFVPLAAIAYIAYLSTLFGFAAWCWLLSRYPVTTIAPFTLLVPIFGMLSSFLVLGESLQLWKILASLLVILGVCVNLLGTKLMLRKIA